jgi:hypothetical protein
MTTPRHSLAAAAVNNNKIYAIGGYNVFGVLSTNEEYLDQVLYLFKKD